MEKQKNYLFAHDSEQMQITYDEYVSLMSKAKEAERVQEITRGVATDLKALLAGGVAKGIAAAAAGQGTAVPVDAPEAAAEEVMKASAAASVGHSERAQGAENQPESESAVEPVSEQRPVAKKRGEVADVPPIKHEISEHYNRLDGSGRLFNIFKQYYTCLNEMCGGTVRVTMKDGFCSLWNYDEWEEFAFVDIFEEQLRIAIDPRYTDELKSQNLCEVPRLLSSRRNVICVKVEDLNNTVLDVLAKAFSEVGMQVG